MGISRGNLGKGKIGKAKEIKAGICWNRPMTQMGNRRSTMGESCVIASGCGWRIDYSFFEAMMEIRASIYE
jgi:hypothetical protein